MDLFHAAPILLFLLVVMALAFARHPEPPRDPDEVERGSTTILPEDR